MIATVHGNQKSEVPFSVLFKSAVGLAIVALVTLGLLGTLFNFHTPDAILLLVAVVGALVGFVSGWLLFRLPSISNK